MCHTDHSAHVGRTPSYYQDGLQMYGIKTHTSRLFSSSVGLYVQIYKHTQNTLHVCFFGDYTYIYIFSQVFSDAHAGQQGNTHGCIISDARFSVEHYFQRIRATHYGGSYYGGPKFLSGTRQGDGYGWVRGRCAQLTLRALLRNMDGPKK